MGGDTDIREEYRDELIIDAWDVIYKVLHGEVVLDDTLCRVRGIKGPRWNHMFTALEFFYVIWKRVHDEIFNNVAAIFVIIVDCSAQVAKLGLKSRVHELRKEAIARSIKKRNDKLLASIQEAETEEEEEEEEKKEPLKPIQLDISNVPYPAGCTLADDGILLPGKQEAEMFDVRRMMSTSYLRVMMWSYVHQQIQKKLIPEGKCVIFEWDHMAPWVYTRNEARQVHSLHHNHAETDTSFQYWMWLFKDRPIRFHTTDTDWIALFFAAMSVIQTKQIMRWVYPNPPAAKKFPARFASRPTEYVVDLNKLYTEVPVVCKLTPDMFVTAFILCGTDHYNKKHITNQFSWKYIFEAVRLAAPELTTMISDIEGHQTGKKKWKAFVPYSRLLHIVQIKGTIVKKSDSAVTDGKKKKAGQKRKHPIVFPEGDDPFEITNKRVKYDKEDRTSSSSSSLTVTRTVKCLVEYDRQFHPDKIGLSSFFMTDSEIQSKKTGQAKRTTIPTTKQLKKAFQEFLFNYHYWAQQFKTHISTETRRKELIELIGISCMNAAV